MNAIRLILTTVLVSLTTFFCFGQTNDAAGNLLFTLRQLSDQSWGVFVKPDLSIEPSSRTTTGSGQVTLVTPVGFSYSDLKNYGGTWIENARVNAPVEAPESSYVSFGFVTDEPKIQLSYDEETLLFTFQADPSYRGSVVLIDNESDPFSTPNSYQSNPGNDLGIIDFGQQGGLQYYTYLANYDSAPQAIMASWKEHNKPANVKNQVNQSAIAPK